MIATLVPYLSISCEFQGEKYEVETFSDTRDQLKIEIRHCSSGEEWHVQLTAAYVEELTRKTGNFKRFDTFCSMIQSALSQRTNTLSLDLVSYDDLEALRQTSLKSRILNSSSPTVPMRNNRYYFILSYVTEFDKIHYPIPLTYVGSLSLEACRELIRKLRAKLYGKKELTPNSAGLLLTTDAHKTILQLQAQNKALMQELEMLRNQVNAYKNSEMTVTGNELRNFGVPEELRVLVNSLETELFNEKSKNSRQLNEYRREIAHLQAELSSSSAYQRNLNRRIEQLNNELSVFKRRRPLCPKETRPFTWGIRSASAGLPHSTPHLVPSRDNYEKSRETGHRSRRDSQLRGGSLDLVQMTRNSNSVCASTIAARPNFLPTGFVQPVRRVGSASPHLCRPSGTPVCESVRYRLNNISRSRDPSPLSLKTSKSPLPRSRSCSEDRAVYGYGKSTRRFDPTAYVRERELRKQERELKRRAERQAQLSSNNFAHGHNNLDPWRTHCIPTTVTHGTRASSVDRSPNVRANIRSNLSSSALSSSCDSLDSRPARPRRARNCGSSHQSIGLNSAFHGYCPRLLQQTVRSSNLQTTSPNGSVCTPSRHHIPGSLHQTNSLLQRKRSPSIVNNRASSVVSLNDSMNSVENGSDIVSYRNSRLQDSKRRPARSCNHPKNSLQSEDQNDDLEEIDRRLNILQDFFQKYLSNT
ncbi:hypothetical protein FBUS_06614 [Fasciolopsis buskii]|uniref:Coiled-coil domain-containing protein 61 n=1 Tax=Fasciolopsis buskii TaxID=27845 RepID=A0A8E0RWU7_9TREM|nr:hypothetical protein FBUS_06614 [Fasciolopsis buski]